MRLGVLPKIDTSELETDATCYTIGTNTIYAFSNNNRKRTEYHILNDKVYKYYVNNYNYNYDISSYTCRTFQDIANMQASSSYIAPFYYSLAFVVACVLLYIPYRILVHPWWRRL